MEGSGFSRNSNGDYSGLGKTKHSCKDEPRGSKEAVVSPVALSCSASRILPCEY